MGMADIESLGLVLQAAPDWFKAHATRDLRVSGTAFIVINAGDEPWEVPLEIGVTGSGVRVREAIPGTQFPERCPDRHIEDEGWFCLGLSSGTMIVDRASGMSWWQSLHSFLRMQRVAARTGLWPEHHSLSHGQAGHHHLRAIELARDVGFADAYEAFVMGEPSVLACLYDRLSDCGRRLLNGRSACPCGRHERDGTPTLRRNCPHRESVVAHLLAERRRRAALASFWEAMRKDGSACCGTMQSCPLGTS